MKWICVYCHKIMDRTSFMDFIKESDNKEAEYHGWQRMLEQTDSNPTRGMIWNKRDASC